MSEHPLEKWLETNIGFENPKLGLERIENAINAFGLKSEAKIVTVAGTNGKGTTSRLIAHTIAAQYKVSLFTSPHIISISERFWINNHFIDKERLLFLFEKNLKDLRDKSIHLSFFEFLFFTFYREVSSEGSDYIVLEVGLGGRYDATNCIDTDIAILTSISRDHIEYFGNSYKKILFEKIGIARKNKPLLTSLRLNYLKNQLELHRKTIGFEHYCIEAHADDDFLDTNKLLASKCLELLDIKQDLVEVSQIRYFGDSQYHLYGSHNLDAVRKLVLYLKQNYYTNTDKFFDVIYLSFSQREKIEIEGMISLFAQLNSKIILLDFDHYKSLKAEDLMEIAKTNGLEFATKDKHELQKNQKVLVSGSNYFIGDFCRHQLSKKFNR
jgi:dihydrofolate synthase/folylpolyglutamate synthase